MTASNEMSEGRLKSVDNAITQIHRQFGKGSIMRLGTTERENIPVIPTGILSVDLALGVGGLPRGRVTEIYGPESSGKTTLALHVIAEAQRRGGNVAFIDAEHALDTDYAERLGVDTDNLLISQPDFGEQALEIAEILIRSGGIDVVVIDSVAALVPRAEIDGNVGDQHVGLQARLMSHAMRKFTGVLSRTNTVLIFINQIRMKIGVMFGNPETTTGGNALKFYSSIRIDIRKTTQIKDGTGCYRQSDQDQGRQKQSGAALQTGGSGYHLWRGHLQDRRCARSGRDPGDRGQERCLVLLSGGTHRPGPGKCQEIPQGASGNPGQHRTQAAPGLGHAG